MDAGNSDGGTGTGFNHVPAAGVTGVFGTSCGCQSASLTTERVAPISRRRRTSWALLFSMLVVQLPLAIRGTEGYLAIVGPAPLHFAPTPRTDFAWPVPLVLTNLATNSVPFPSPVDSESTTNALILSARSPDPLPVAPVNQEFGPLAFPAPAGMPSPPGTNAPSASNLLNVTPQMLADYLKASMENSSRFSTNGVNAPEVPFNPPLPWPKASPSGPGRHRVQ